jgi:hypothetical protein
MNVAVTRLVRTLAVTGPLTMEALARWSGAHSWRRGELSAAVHRGVREGRLRELPFGFVAAQTRSEPDRAS